jgi:DUF4097 and DUF4098 domain-containing protein YvlB
MKTVTWSKYTYVCTGECDALIEYTMKAGYTPNVTELTCLCGSPATLLSVADATILPITEKKEETMETMTPETYNPNLLVTYKKIENGEVSYPSDKVVDIEYALDQSRRNYKNLVEKQNAWYSKESQLRTLLEEVYADSSEQDTLSQIAEIFDVPLTKEIEVTAYVRVDLTVEVDMADGDYDIESLVSDNLNVDSYGGEISVTNFEIERVEEGAY